MVYIFASSCAGAFCWECLLGQSRRLSLVPFFFTPRINRKLLDALLGFSGGVMLAAYWSLLAPSMEIASHGPTPSWFPPAIGFLVGGATLWVLDKSLAHLHLGFPIEEAESPATSWRRTILSVTAITLQNIPEGLAFGGAIVGVPSISVAAAVVLAIGIGIQNFPEGIAVPCRFALKECLA